MDGEIGPQRCLLCNPNSSRAPEMVTFLMARPTISVPMPAIWPVFSSPSIHQGDSPHSGLVETTGDEEIVSYIDGFLLITTTYSGGSSAASQVYSGIFPTIRFSSQTQ